MPRRRSDAASSEALARLRALDHDPIEQVELALELVAEQTRLDILKPALKTLSRYPDASHRGVLLARYEYFNERGLREDQGCHIRIGILGCLSDLVTTGDTPLLERAVETYEFLPPGRSESAAGLRAAALTLLARTDPELSAYRAAQLVSDEHTEQMSGEPAMTAVRLLALQGRTLCNYQFLCSGGNPVPEVTGECLRSLGEVPASCLRRVVEDYAGHDSDVVLLGLVDLLLEHPDGLNHLPTLEAMLAASDRPELYHYLVTVLAASRRPELVTLVLEAADSEVDFRRLASLEEALSLLPESGEVNAALDRIRRKLARRGSQA